jgi:hypothetical protein
MNDLSELELAVLRAIADHEGENADILRQQIASAHAAGRLNTGAGFYTTLAVSGEPSLLDRTSPVGRVTADVGGLANGMGFLLWLRDGQLHELEGYTVDESIEGWNLTALRFSNLRSWPKSEDR